MKRTPMTPIRLAASTTLVATSVILLAILAPAGAAAAPSRATLQLRHTRVGPILTNGRGFTVYMFSSDRLHRDRCVKVSGCTGVWPLVKTAGKPRAGRGVKSRLIGTIALPGGGRQVTYAGHPLYTYVADSGPGQTFYVGVKQFGGFWYALNAAGKTVK